MENTPPPSLQASIGKLIPATQKIVKQKEREGGAVFASQLGVGGGGDTNKTTKNSGLLLVYSLPV